MTDPRAALAESLEAAGMYEKDDPTEYPGSPIHVEDAVDVQKRLAQRGVLLVSKERLTEALARSGVSYERPALMDADDIWAALSAEATGVQPKLPAPRKPQP